MDRSNRLRARPVPHSIRRRQPGMMARIVAAIALAAAPAAAEPCFEADEPVEIAAIDGREALQLTDGRAVRLADIRIAESEKLAARARVVLEEAGPGTLLLRPVRGAPTDRYGRLQADIVVKDTGASLREQIVLNGLAFVDPTVISEGCLTSLFAAERAAETAGFGLWGRPESVLDAARADLTRYTGQYALVSGTVKSVGETKRTLYLNFGENFRTDFTAIIRRADASGWGSELAALAGESVRIRGVLEAWNGGLIRVEHPAQIERRDSSGL
ncbi:thermonuclease family protein [Acuticoccus kandeliae]|uniref:thermonuclease family protein n=1 Tax=Acuticoccus kandeliae TaxID=2073160 RepID=UPI000D3E9B25|nr:thermonuclease family protein [Acuticoccus kandeliae]